MKTANSGTGAPDLKRRFSEEPEPEIGEGMVSEGQSQSRSGHYSSEPATEEGESIVN
jgi:hypothetical protein